GEDMRSIVRNVLAVCCLAALVSRAGAAEKKAAAASKTEKADQGEAEKKGLLSSKTWKGLELRSIGPALTPRPIPYIAVEPGNSWTCYVAAASGGVWKTENGGSTFAPVFDGEGSYSIGSVAIDPGNPHVVWVGSGEYNSQRSVSYGDGVYRSED